MTMSPNITGNAWIPTTDTFPARLALVRHRMGWNLKEAATECGLAMNAWARYEEGMAPRNLIDVVEKISARTGVDRYWLTFGNTAPTPGGGNAFLAWQRRRLGPVKEPTGYLQRFNVFANAAA